MEVKRLACKPPAAFSGSEPCKPNGGLPTNSGTPKHAFYRFGVALKYNICYALSSCSRDILLARSLIYF